MSRYLTFSLSALGKPSDRKAATPQWLTADMSYEQAYQHVRNSLRTAGFSEFSLYLLPDEEQGFFVYTAPERTDEVGKVGRDRFNVVRKEPSYDSLKARLFDFFSNNPEGYFRFFIIAVTPEIPSQNTNTVPWDDRLPLTGEYQALPQSLGTNVLGMARLHAYLYRYERGRLELNPHETLTSNPIDEHLAFARLTELVYP